MPGVPVPPEFIRPDPPHPDGPATNKSTVCKLNDGSQKLYPSLGDYLEHYKSLGIVKDLDDLVQNYAHLIGELFFNWVRSGQLGCLFAVHLAKDPRKNRWLPIVQLRALQQGDSLGELLNTQLDAAAERNEAAAIIFPDVVSPDQVVELINLLCADPSRRWYRTNDGIDPDESDALCLVGLRWILPSRQSVNYVLGFSPIETMPQTRQSPFTAIFLRIIDEKRTPPHREDGLVQVHLADLDSTFYPQAVHDQVWELTKATRKNAVQPHMTAAARARVTFSLPKNVTAKLCAPRSVVLEKVETELGL